MKKELEDQLSFEYWYSKIRDIDFDMKWRSEIALSNFNVDDKQASMKFDMPEVTKSKWLSATKGNPASELILLLVNTLIFSYKSGAGMPLATVSSITKQNNERWSPLFFWTEVAPDTTFKSLIGVVQKQFQEINGKSHYDFEKLEIHFKDKLRTLLEVGCGHQQYEGRKSIIDNFGLYFEINEHSEIIVLYDSGKYSETSIKDTGEAFVAILSNGLAQPEKHIDQIKVLSEKEEADLLESEEIDPRPQDFLTVIDTFEQMAESHPHTIALVDGHNHYSYQQVNCVINQLAKCFTTRHGVSAGDKIVLKRKNDAFSILSILSILKSGAVYVPIDVDLPNKRTNQILHEVNPKIVLTDDIGIQDDFVGQVVKLEEVWKELDTFSDDNIGLKVDHHDQAYIIYTSGSTGIPKGVVITHGSLMNLILGLTVAVDYKSNWQYIISTSLSFDASIKQIFIPFTIGGRLHVCKNYKDIDHIAYYTYERSIDTFHASPWVWQRLLNILDKSSVPPFQCVSSGGDELSIEQARKMRDVFPGATLFNLYGPTETCINASYYEVLDKGDIVPIGKALPNYKMYVLNKSGNLIPSGWVGEIYIGGRGLGEYYDKANASSNSFMPNPFSKQEKIYKTGDLGYYDNEGNIIFLGRRDGQIKSRGFRMELKDIEANIIDLDFVENCFISAKKKGDNDHELVAYWTSGDKNINPNLREALADRLPDFMIPTFFIKVNSFPVRSNGKIDVAALPEPGRKTYIAPVTETEVTLSEIWESLLGQGKIGVEDDFFELGGHSLKIIQLISKVHSSFGFNIQYKDVLSNSTLASMAQLIEAQDKDSLKKILPLEEQAHYNLSHAQKRIWIVEQQVDSAIFNISKVFDLKELNPKLFVRALDDLVRRFDALRTNFIEVDGEPRQKVLDYTESNFEVRLKDISDSGNQKETIENYLRTESAFKFDLMSDSLLRILLIKTSQSSHVLILTIHHVVSDRWSLDVMFNEILISYKRFLENPDIKLEPEALQYKDYAGWHNKQLGEERLDQYKSYWTEQFSGGFERLKLPLDRARPAVSTYRGKQKHYSLSIANVQRLREMAFSNKATVFMVALSMLKMLLSRYSQQSDIILGGVLAGRQHTDLEKQLGFFVNTVVLRTKLDPSDSVLEVLQKVKEVVAGAYDHQVYPFDQLVNDLNIQRDQARPPLFDVRVEIHSHDQVDQELLSEFQWSESQDYQHNLEHSKDDLHFLFYETNDGLSLFINYNTDLYFEKTIDRLFAHFNSLMEEVFEQPDIKIKELNFLDQKEQSLLAKFSQSTTKEIKAHKLHQLFEAQVLKTPHRVALSYKDISLTYYDLNKRANDLANYLIHNYNVRSGDVVGVLLSRSEETVIAILGIMKAGAAYLPIANEFPRERKVIILQDAQVDVLISETKHIFDLEGYSGSIISLDLIKGSHGVNKGVALPSENSDLAYVIYTSGSTGRPKGVLINHQGIINTVKWRNDYYKFDQNTVNLQIPSYSFDSSVEDIFCILISGGKLIIPEEEKRTTPTYFIEQLEKHSVTHFLITPSFYKVILPSLAKNSTLKAITIAGENVTEDLVNSHFGKIPDVRLINEYGPTENSVCSTFSELSSGEPVTVGKPITNTRVYILDKHKNLLPIGVPGEIHVSGRGLAVGYLCRPELTKQKFVSSPFAEGERLYCTGDLGKWNMNGDLEFLGRIDEQVKVRGYRVELSEIERHILECEWMSDAKVILKEEESTTNLIGFLIGDRDHREELIAHLSAYLPHYMIPDNLVYLDSFPLTVHGKIDLKRLSDHKIEVEQEEYIAPTSELEKTITNFCEDILGKTRVSTADSFFKLGGDSIKAIQLSSKMNTAGYRLEVADILKQPIISKLVQLAKPNKTVVNQEIISGEIPLTPIQHWFLDTPRKEYKHYNQAILLKLKQPLNTIQLEQVAAKLQLHHDALRIIFSKVGRVWEQNNLSDDLKAEVGEYDLGTGKHATERLEEITTDLQRTLDINQGPLMKMVLFHIDGEHRLLITVHHLVIDGVSWRIILQDIDMLITQLFAGDDLALPPKTSSFQSWSFLLQRYAKSQKIAAQREYWQKELSNYTPSLQRDFDSKENTVSSMASSGFKLSNQLTTQLLTTAHNAYTSTINELLLSALVMSLNSMWISDNILIWLEGHGREKIDPTIDVTRTVGWFTTVFPVNFTTDKTHQWDNTIVGVKEKLRNIPGKGLGFGVLKYLKELQEDTSFHLDGPQILFNYLGQFDQDFNQSTIAIADEPVKGVVSPSLERDHDWDIISLVSDGQLDLSIRYSQDQYSSDTIERFVQLYEKNLIALLGHCEAIVGPILTPADLTYGDLEMADLSLIESKYGKISDVYELSQMQEGMLFHSELEKSSNAYVNQISYDLKGEIDIPKVEMSLNELIKRHDVLRTSFHTDHKRNLQIVVQERPIEFFTNDLSRSTDDIDAQIDQYKEKDLQRGFRLDEDVLMRVALFKKSDDLYTFIWTHHHIIIDGWCSAILISEYTNIYQGLVQDIPYESSDVSPFKNYIKWLRNIDTDKTKRYWKDYLSGFDTLSEVPKKPVSVEGKSYDHKELSLILDQPTTNALANLANSFDVTLNVLIRTIWGYLLGRYNDSEDIVCGAVVSGRPSEIDGIENMVGLFINTIPVRLKWSENTTFQDLLVDTQADSLASESHHYMSLSEIQSHSELKQNLLDHIIVFENYPVDEAISGKSISDTEVLNVDVYEQTSYDFNILVSPGDRLSIKFVFNGEVYSGDLVNRIKSHLLYLITQIIDQPAKRLSEVEIVPLEERDRLTRQSELSEIDTSKMLTIPKQIKFQAQRTPHATALVFKDHHYTFREVDQISNRIADLLIAHRLITKGDIVGVALNRSEWMVFAILGIIKSGAAYLPLDPAHPYERLKYQLEDASVKTVIYEGDILQSHDMRGISLNEIQSQLESFSTDQPDLDISLSDLMYVIYTSGSTGRPKGVAVEYTGVINRIDWLWNKYSFDSKDVLFQKTPYVFDVSVGELFMGLCHGAKTVICPKEALDDTKALWKNIRDHSITTVHFVPSMLNAFLDYAINEPGVTLTGVKRVLTSGEELKLATTKKYYSKFSIPLYNLYGPTEASIEVTFYETRPNDLSVPIGKPISNVDIFVLDSKMRLVPPGVNGMIYIGGIALARGYINDPEKTKGSFFDHPFREGEFLYRTGDIGQWLEEGNVQFLGREDDQIKIRGYRVELSEIENQILTLPSVKNAAVVTNVSSNGDVAIVAYYESSTDIELNDEIKASLEFALPPYMIPQAFVFVEELPLTSSNKIDKKLLSLYDPTFNSKKNIVLPSTELEKRIANIWEEILGHNDLSMNDNFFEIGGHSLKALQLISRIRSDFKIELDLKEIYEFSTLKLLSDEIEKIFTLRKSTHEETVSPEQKEIIL